MKSNNIPSDEDFARASAALSRRSRGLSQVSERILNLFRKSDDIYEFFIMDCSDTSFRASVFFRWNLQIKEANDSGLSARIINAVYAELESVGRGARSAIKVEFEFDSHENVELNYEGDYFLRLR